MVDMIPDRVPIPPPAAPAGSDLESDPLDLVKLAPLMAVTAGRTDVTVALIDGPVARDHPDLANERIRAAPGHEVSRPGAAGAASAHGTFVAGILSGRRGSPAPAICPECTLLVRPIFSDEPSNLPIPSASTEELAVAVAEAVRAGADVINVSAELPAISGRQENRRLMQALDLARRHGVLVVAAAGNRSSVGGSALISHPWVIPVVGYASAVRPASSSNLGASIGRRGLGAPGNAVVSLAPSAGIAISGGTSAAAPFVTGTIALLRSVFGQASAAELWVAVVRTAGGRRRSVVPPLLDASAAGELLQALGRRPDRGPHLGRTDTAAAGATPRAASRLRHGGRSRIG